jgi:hypothetical protein
MRTTEGGAREENENHEENETFFESFVSSRLPLEASIWIDERC